MHATSDANALLANIIKQTPTDLDVTAKVVFWMLAERGTSTALDLIPATGLARPTVYKHLKALVDRGLVEHIDGRYSVVRRAA